MDKKILLQNLADSLADRTGLTKRKAEAFVRSFFEITEESLDNDGSTKVKGFGTTKIVQVSDRESVDINTGERIQIEGHAKVTFTPDTMFRDLVNRPFAHFTTIVLEDEVDESEIISTPDVDNEEESAETEATTTQEAEEMRQEAVKEIQEAAETTAEDTTAEETTTEDTTAEETTTEDTTAEETSTVETFAEETTKVLPVSGIAGPIEEATEDGMENEETIPSLDETEPSEHQEQQITIEEQRLTDDPLHAEEKLEAVEETITTEEKLEAVEEVFNTEEPLSVDDEDEEEVEPLCATGSGNTKSPIIINNTIPEPRHNWWKTAFVVLFTILLSLASYFAGYFRIFCPCNFFGTDAETITATEAKNIADSDAKAKADSIEKAKADSVAKAKADSANAATQQAAQQLAAQQAAAQATAERLAAQQAAAEKAAQRQAELQAAQRYDQIPGSNYLITGVMQNRRIRPGENLYMIARQMYGHKDFARYIAFFNNIEDPNHVTIGQTIRLPKLTRK